MRMKPILQLCEEQCHIYLRMICCMESKVTRLGEIRNEATGEMMTASIERIRMMVKELDDLLAEHGRKRC
jgi:hypothetical protein